MEGYIFLQDRELMNYSEMCLETLTEIALKKNSVWNLKNQDCIRKALGNEVTIQWIGGIDPL